MSAINACGLIALAPAKIRLAYRRFKAARALEASRRNCDVLIDYIDLYQRELAHEQRRQVRLSNDLAKLK